MICEICGKEYRLLANHVWQKHDISVRDYKIKYNIPLSKALADDDWINQMRAIGQEEKESERGKKNIANLIDFAVIHNRKLASGEIPSPTAKRKDWPKISIDKINAIGATAKKKHALEKLEIVKKEWGDGVSVKALSVCSNTAAQWVKDGFLPKRKKTISAAHVEKLRSGRMVAK